MKRLTTILFILLSVVISSFAMQNKEENNPNFDNYDDSWKQVTEFENNGKPKSALEIVKAIVLNARKDNNSPQLVKGLLYQFKYEMVLEEDSELKIVNSIREEILNTDDAIAKSILQSILAESMWQYYQDNRYKFINRTQTTNYDEQDFQTWDLAKLLNEIRANYFNSIEAYETLQKASVSAYDDILIKQEESEIYRPTLYDLLAHRAIDFFGNSLSGLTEPVVSFKLDNEAFFQPAKSFIEIKLPNELTSLEKDALQVFQALLSFRLNEKNIKALVDADLKRLDFLYNNVNLENKDQLYLNALKQLAKQHKGDDITAYVNYKIADKLNNNSNKDDNTKLDRVKALQLCEETIATYPNAFGSTNCKELLQRIQSTNLSATIENIVIPNEPFKVLVNYRNLDNAQFKIVHLSDDDLEENIDYNKRDKWLNKLISKEAEQEWTAALPNPKDYHQHTTEIKAEEIPVGTYALLISHDNFKNNVSLVKTFWASDISYVTRNKAKGGLEFYLASRTSGAALSKALIDVYYQIYDYDTRKNVAIKLGSYVSDENGFFEINQVENRNRNIYLKIKHNEDYLNEIQQHYVNQYRTPKKRIYTNTYFFTDRAIYRPGQTIYFKGIMVESNGSEKTIKANQSTTVTLRDVNYQEIAVLNLKTNEFGSFQGSFTAPSGGLNGQMSIIGDGGQKSVQVEEYKRPTFEVILDTLEGGYSLNQTVTVTGKGLSYAGAPIIESKVKYRVVREVIYPRWYWWSWRKPIHTSDAKEITNGETITGKDGSYAIDFVTAPDLSIDKKNQPKFRYTIYVDIVDISGETRSGEKTITAGYVGLDLNVNVPENWDRDSKQVIAVTTTNLDGRKEAAIVDLNIYQLTPPTALKKKRYWAKPDLFAIDKTNHEKWFPNDVYKDETNMEDWERKLVKSYQINTGQKTSIDVLPNDIENSGVYWVEATTKDNAGNKIESKSSFVAVSKSDKKLPQPNHLKVSTNKTSFQPGETATLSIGTSVKNARLVYLLSFDGNIIDKQYLNLNDEIKKIEIPILESQRGGLQVMVLMINENRVYQTNQNIEVPFKDQALQVEWMTFRDLLEPGQKEQWKLKIKGPEGDIIASELLAGMYDKSLDYFMPHNFHFPVQLNPSISHSPSFNAGRLFSTLNANTWRNETDGKYIPITTPNYDYLNFYGFYLASRYYRYERAENAVYQKRNAVSKTLDDGSFGFAEGAAAPVAAMAEMDMAIEEESANDSFMDENSGGIGGGPTEPKTNETSFAPRKNLNETAFFFPQLQTNEKGEVIIDFTMPEALTTWKFLGFAHNKMLQHHIFSKEVKTQKDLMVTPNAPRFLREGDKITLTAKIDNLSDKALTGNAQLILKDALTNEVIDHLLLTTAHQVNFNIDAKGSTVATWELNIPKSVQAVTYEIYAKSGEFTDGVTSTIPVLTNRMLVTETMPVWLKGEGSRIFTFRSLKDNDSKTLEHEALTLEYTSNPVWYAVQALPYLMEFPHECTEQLFSRYYANSLAEHIATSNPRIQAVFEQWKNTDTDALISNLEKNQELKALLIEETPWLRNAVSETERKKRIALLFDLNRMSNEKITILKKLIERQTPNGGFSWFPGMRDSRYMTQHILSDIAHLKQLNVTNVINDESIKTIVQRAIPYLDERIAEDLERIKKYNKNWKKEDHLGAIQIHYLYMRGQFKEFSIPAKTQEAYDYFLQQANDYWLKRDFYQQGMIAIALHNNQKQETAQKVMESIKEHSIVNDEMGMYWKAIEQGGYYWYNAPIESHALLIEAFHTVMNDQDAVNEMKVWLLKQKQVQDWKTTKATTEAIYALLLRGEDWLSNTEMVEVKVGKKIIDPTQQNASYEAGTGYFKVNWDGKEVTKEMAEVTVTSKNNAPSWGAMYWQYFEDLDQIKSFEETPLELKKSVYVETVGNSGPVITPIDDAPALKAGDKLKIRIELRVDRNMEYVHMKDMRASGLEPINVLSHYKYQDGLGYYESTKDAATHFFFDYLPKGVYVFEYPLRVTHKGDFSNGITTIQSMYAPEFTSHSEGIRLEVE